MRMFRDGESAYDQRDDNVGAGGRQQWDERRSVLGGRRTGLPMPRYRTQEETGKTERQVLRLPIPQ